MGPDTGVNIFPRPHGLSLLRVEEGEFGGEFEGNSREFDGGFGEFDVFQYVRGAMNPSAGAKWGRGKVSFYKIKRGDGVKRGSGEGSWVGNGMEKGGAAQKLGPDPQLPALVRRFLYWK